MLVRTNIYLAPKTIAALKANAEEKRKTMAELIREILKKTIKETKKNWTQSLLVLAQKAEKSGLGNLARRHDEYLYAKKSAKRKPSNFLTNSAQENT